MARKRDGSIPEGNRGVETRDLERKRRVSREGMRRLRAEKAARAVAQAHRDADESGDD